MTLDPHALVEGIIIASYAIRSNQAYIYIRGEAVARGPPAAQRGRRRRSEGFISATNILVPGSTWTCRAQRRGRLHLREETALLDSLEGSAASPGCARRSGHRRPVREPTVVNNVGTIPSVPYIVLGGADWWKSMGRRSRPAR